MAKSFKEVIEALVNERIENGEDPQELFDELTREANLIFGHYSLEYELGMQDKNQE